MLQKPSQDLKYDLTLARGRRVIKMIIDALPQVTTSKISKRTQEKMNESSNNSKSSNREQKQRETHMRNLL